MAHKTKPLTKEDVLALGPVPEELIKHGKWLGPSDDPRDDAVYDEAYQHGEFTSFFDWPYNSEGVVFDNQRDLMEFVYTLSRNQNMRYVWFSTPAGFPQKASYLDIERQIEDDDWDPAVREARDQLESEAKGDEQGLSVQDQLERNLISANEAYLPSRTEHNRVKAKRDPNTGHFSSTGIELEPFSPQRDPNKKVDADTIDQNNPNLKNPHAPIE